MMGAVSTGIVSTELVALVTAVVDHAPMVLTATADGEPCLPSGPLQSEHDSMQAGLRSWVEQQTEHTLGYVEQLYTFADPARADDPEDRIISVSYLGLTRTTGGSQWRCVYEFFPWEDHRLTASAYGPAPRPDGGNRCRAEEIIEDLIVPSLRGWIETSVDSDRADDRDSRDGSASDTDGNGNGNGNEDGGGGQHVPDNTRSAAESAERRRLRAEVCFGLGGRPWAPELALQRYELLYEVGLISESPYTCAMDELLPGHSMAQDHRRILATGLTRLRSKIQYRPVVFELLPETFTLGQLQSTVESLAGQTLHKQNFRRLVTQQELVEPTGETDTDTGGRPARLFRFRRAVLDDWHVAGTKLPRPR